MLTAKPATALTVGFQDEYAPANWTFTNGGTDGSVDTTNAPTSISLTGGNNSNAGNTDFLIAAPADGTVSFNWDYLTSDVDGPSFDQLFRVLDGAQTQLSNDGGLPTQNGSDSFAVIAGQVFGFRIFTGDGSAGSATTTFSNFSAPSATPVPFEFSPVVGLTMLSVGYGVKRLWHKKKATKL